MSGANEEESKPQAAGGAIQLILIQVVSRALTFAGNQFLLRYLSPSLLGIAVQLELLSVSTLYLARESLRVALQRAPPTTTTRRGDHETRSERDDRMRREGQRVVNLSYLACLIGTILSLLFGFSYLHAASQEVRDSPDFNFTFKMYAAATLIELLAEPSFVVIQQHSLYTARARAETGAALARCISACLVAIVGHQRGMAPSTLPFAVGQFTYAVTLAFLYLRTSIPLSKVEHFGLTPRPLTTSSTSTLYIWSLFHRSTTSLAGTMYLQSIFKLLLTQGDALILSILASLAEQGAFALASNYGGLLARLLFQPLEESSRNTFGRLLASAGTEDDPKGQKKTKNDGAVDRRKALDHLARILHFYHLLTLFFFSVAPHLLPLAVRHLAGSRWYTPTTASLLAAYCFYIPFMAVNGILDAFVTSVATSAQLRAQSVWMILFTGVYGVAAWLALKKLKLGAVGLVLANGVNMAARIVWSINFIVRWLKANDTEVHHTIGGTIRDTLPKPLSVLIAVVTVVGLRLTGVHGPSEDKKDLNLEEIGYVLAGTSLLGSTM